MKRKGAGTSSQPSSSSNPNDIASRDSVSTQRGHSTHHSLYTIAITSVVWSSILFSSLIVVSRYYSSTNCQQNNLLPSALCTIGQALTRFCSSSDPNVQILSPSGKFTHDSSKGSSHGLVFTDTYAAETCEKGGLCSKKSDFYQIPNQASLTNKNPSSWPGEMGEPYLPPDHLQEESKRRFSENMFDIAVSDRIALNRAMPDIRNDHCKAHSTFNNQLPNTSIIIVFHNEGNSTLLRTLVSIINRTPWNLIHEIILLDDASVERDYLYQPLETFIRSLPVATVLLRNEKRSGLISSRVRAARYATGQTLMFLDSHVEVLNGWIFYLLEEIQKDRTTIVCPIIDVLTYDAFQLLNGATDIFGTFSWKMIFRWSKIQNSDQRSDQAKPIETPTMAGGLYAIDRLYFEELGMYDEGIKIWGGENLEMSFKCWMCGGRIVIHPCSHVAHVFRKETPYKFLDSESVFVTIFKNYKRVALVWLDEYKQLIYAVNPDIKRLPGGDVSDRLELRQRLNCSSFRSYLQRFQLKNFPLNPRFIGSISTPTRLCLDSLMGPDISKGANTAVSAQACHTDGGNQIFLYTLTKKIHFDELCLEPAVDQKAGAGRSILFIPCEESRREQNWIFDQQSQQLKSEFYSGQCLTLSGQSNVVLAQCDQANANQRWTFNQEVRLENE